MAKAPFVTDEASQNRSGSGGHGDVTYQNQNPEALQGEAPGGLFFSQNELPVSAVPGGNPAQLNGYTPNPRRTPQESIKDAPRRCGNNMPPSGLAR